jgi:flagellar export protein FliJ
MSKGIHTGVDLRGFRWPLGVLERKLEHAVDVACAALGAVQADAGRMATTIRALEAQKAAQLQGPSAEGDRINAAEHVRSLRFLAQVEGLLAGRNRELATLRERVDAARQDCVKADRNLARVRRLRESAEAAYASEELRRQAKDADLAWLAFAARARARRWPAEEARR